MLPSAGARKRPANRGQSYLWLEQKFLCCGIHFISWWTLAFKEEDGARTQPNDLLKTLFLQDDLVTERKWRRGLKKELRCVNCVCRGHVREPRELLLFPSCCFRIRQRLFYSFSHAQNSFWNLRAYNKHALCYEWNAVTPRSLTALPWFKIKEVQKNEEETIPIFV